MDAPLFSLILFVSQAPHLLPLTLDSLKPQKSSFEILLFGPPSLQELIKKYPELQIRLEPITPKLAEMMNRGVALSRGKYIQFLEAGDHYISQYGLEFLAELTIQEPSLICAQGISPNTPSHWFLKKRILELGGFDERLQLRPLFDLLCRFQKQPASSIFCRRVLVDLSSKPQNSFLETCKILHRHFGSWHTLKWIFHQDRAPIWQRAGTFLKEAFWRED